MVNLLENLCYLKTNIRRERISSWDRTGSNEDFILIPERKNAEIAHFSGAGCIRHIWMTMASQCRYPAREIVLRMYWDGENSPSVETPIGDFFGIGHGIIKNFWSMPLCMSPADGRAFNCFFAMPFKKGFRVTVENESDFPLEFYYYIDFESWADSRDELAYFHAQWRRENPTDGWGDRSELPKQEILAAKNLSSNDNYVILEAQGKGHYVGCHLDIDCYQKSKMDWYGEGDDMIVIDGEVWPPRLHGTGTEDYFNTAYCPNEEFCTPFHGITVNSGNSGWRWKGKNSLYRYHIADPIYFERSIRVSIEHGHANSQSNDYASTAYWYQSEPHAKFPDLLPAALRLPRE
jgi:hypothetical protein